MIRPQASKPGSGSRFRASFRRQKPSFLENFRTTLSGPQHLPIAKNEEAKRHDRGTLSQNEAFVACAGFTSQQCLYPVEIREISKEQLAGLELCRGPSTKKRHNWNDLEIVANCKDTPIRRCGGNQRGNWRDERRPCDAMTGPTRAGDKSTTPRYGVTLLRWETGFAGEHGLVEKDLSRGEAHNYSMEARSDPFESAKSHFFDTSSWGEFCDVTLTLKQAWQPDRGGWAKIDDYRCRQAFRHFMNLLNRAVYGSAFRRHGKRLRVLPVLEKGEVRARALRPWECCASGRWHIHCAIELPLHFDAITLENMIRECWAKVEWGHGRILVRDGANAGWIDYMSKDRQKSEFDGFLDCIIIESLHNPIADA